MLELPSHYVETAGYKTHYVSSGSGAPVLLIHGGGLGADGLGNWKGCIPGYAAHLHVHAYDMVGFGKTDAPDAATFPYNKQARADQAIALIEALDAGPVSIVGNSMGAVVALDVALRRPELLHKIVLMGCPALSRKVPPAIINGTHDFSREGVRKVIRALTLPGFEVDEELVDYRFNLMNEKPEKQRAYTKTIQTVIDGGGIFIEDEQLATIKTKALVFQGRDDRPVPVEEGFRLLQLLPEAHGYFLPHCGHWAMMEHPETFVRVSLDFLLNA